MTLIKPALLTCAFASGLTASCTSDIREIGDQTALLQSHVSRKTEMSLLQTTNSLFPKLSNLNDPHTRKSALLEMEKTAIELAGMDRSEATDVVIEVCTSTADLLNSTVLDAIISEDATDRASLDQLYAAFDQWEIQRQQAEDQIAAAAEVVSQRAFALSYCREVETETCRNETNCTMVVDQDCIDRDRIEEELQEIDEEIENQWCHEGAVRTHTEFRTSSVSVFHRYTLKLTELEIAQGLCDEATQNCENVTTRYTTQARYCGIKQGEWEAGACEYRHIHAAALEAYEQGFTQTLTMYNDEVARVQIMERDRKVEWDVLTRVICLLLTLTTEGDGVVSSDETAARIQRCWDDDVDTSHLDILYLDPPDMLGLPLLPPSPCEVTHVSGVINGPPAECSRQMTMYDTESNSVCTCSADEISTEEFKLGHFLLIDPDLSLEVMGGGWSVEIDGETFTGFLSAAHVQDFAGLSAEMMTPDEIEEHGPIASIAWAYPSESQSQGAGRGRGRRRGPVSVGLRFARSGGLVFMNAAGHAIMVRELATTSGLLGQPVSATLSFSAAEEITDEQMEASCPTMQAVEESTSPYSDYGQGAREYCWIMGSAIIPECLNGCFLYNMEYGKAAFPVISGLHLYEYSQSVYGQS